MWLLPLVLLPISGLTPAHIKIWSASEIIERVCPNCQEIKDGEINEFWIIHTLSTKVSASERPISYLSRAHFDRNFERGPDLFSTQPYALFEIPVYAGNDTYHNYLMEVNWDNQLKIGQVPLANKTFEIPGPGYCFKEDALKFDRWKAFVYNECYVASKNSSGHDITSLCDETRRACFPGLNIDHCFDYPDKRCVTDFQTNVVEPVTQNGAIYKWGRLIVYVVFDKVKNRCLYLIHDTVTKSDWFIPDTIKISKDFRAENGKVLALIPLITSKTPFLQNLERSTTKVIEEEAIVQEEVDLRVYILAAAGVVIFISLVVIIIFVVLSHIRKKKERNALIDQIKTEKVHPRSPQTKSKASSTGSTMDIRTSAMMSFKSPITSTQSTKTNPTTTDDSTVERAELNRLFEANEIENLEAELPNKPLKEPAKPEKTANTLFESTNVVLPAGVFKQTFGEFDLTVGKDERTVQYEYESCGLNRTEAIATIMDRANQRRKNGNIQEMVCTAHLPDLKIKIVVTPKLGISLEDTIKTGNPNLREKFTLVDQTLSCMEDLLECNIIHRDIKPSAFKYELDGHKMFITYLGLARIMPFKTRDRVPFFGNLDFASHTSHLQLERTYHDDMISWLYVIIFIMNKEMLIWKGEKDKTVVYQLKSNLMEEKKARHDINKYIKDQKAKEFLKELFQLILALSEKNNPSYAKIRLLVNSLPKEKV